MLVALALPWVHLQGCQRRMVVLEGRDYAAILLVALVDVEVLRAHVEVVLLTFSEVEAVGIDRLPIICGATDWGLLCSHSWRRDLSGLLD